MTPGVRRLAFVLAFPLVAACGERGTAPSTQLETPVQVNAALTGSAVAWLSVEVTASDIPVPIVVTLEANGSAAHGSVTVPAGEDRTFTARGFDVEGTLTHRAVATMDVRPGTGTTIALVLRPVTDAGVGTGGEDRVTLPTN